MIGLNLCNAGWRVAGKKYSCKKPDNKKGYIFFLHALKIEKRIWLDRKRRLRLIVYAVNVQIEKSEQVIFGKIIEFKVINIQLQCQIKIRTSKPIGTHFVNKPIKKQHNESRTIKMDSSQWME